MIIVNKETLARHSNLKSHAENELSLRMTFNSYQRALIDNHGQHMTERDLILNNAALFGRDYWLEIDRQAAEVFDDERGREIYNDLQSLVTVLPVGKTVKAYTKIGDISDDVAISMDGHTPHDFDHTNYDTDGDPIPMFTAGYGVNWRHWMGLQTENIDLMLDSQRAKLVKFYEATANYTLNGAAKISEAGFKGQGIKNHRNTVRINLGSGSGGFNIDLTTASNADVVTFFSRDFASVLDANAIGAVDVLWVSPQIRAVLGQPFNASEGIKSGTVEENLLKFSPRIREVRTDFSLVGNEFISYVRSKSWLEVPTGQAVTIVPMPRPLPRDNFNNDISTAFGISVKRDGRGRGGVFYAANFA